MSNDLRDLLDRGAATPSTDLDVHALLRTARGRRRRRVGAIAGAMVAVFAVIAGAVALAAPSSTVSTPARPAPQPSTSVPDGWKTIMVPHADLSLAIPPEWTKLRTFGDEVVTVGTSDIERTGYLAVCGDGKDLQVPPVAGTWVSLVEYRDLGPNDEVPLRLNTGLHVKVSNLARPTDLRDANRSIGGCGMAAPSTTQAPSLYGEGEHHQVVFEDAGRVFVATIIIRDPVDDSAADLAYQVLNTLTVGASETAPTTVVTVAPTAPTVPLSTVPVTVPPGDASGDEAAIRDVFLAWINAQPKDALDGVVEDYASIADVHRQGVAQHTDADLASYSGQVDSVTIISPTRAEVQYTILHGGVPDFSRMPGEAIKVDGKWMVTRQTVCNLLKYGGLTCPPRA